MKLVLKPKAPRNPFVALALKRKAGTHTKPIKAERRSAKDSIKRELSSARLEQPALNRKVDGFESLSSHQEPFGQPTRLTKWLFESPRTVLR